ncbi:succinate--CoA ligase subunit alpha [Candidatus Nanohalobium constans]|uniref:Succinyl-CoA synthetase alpha subunit n=1 Tax=Candidatus Nanohalobium constans TaxID=2565781 RepID=A0A5Q0UH12_9ARCH|nr:succinate--CoA ligase subunit alpha [Candidatus Nanohalobium constans]QGA80907.1 succinyl-CoA synthetase alpha subunit [Candidatus Nanohalobium constans]
MSIFANEDTKLVIQGITGRAASEKTPHMIDYGTDVVAGVTPGKGGEEVHGVPVYDTVREAKRQHPEINTSLVYVPHFAAKDAILEALDNDITEINVTTERIPTRDMWEVKDKLEQKDATLVGPTSVGVISPGKSKIGPIGGNKAEEAYEEGNIGIISKSGGMTTETAQVVQNAGFGISTAMDIGGDKIAGTNFVEALKMFEEDDQTDAVVIFGELGGTYENQVAEVMDEISMPVVVFITGEFTESMPTQQYGHAGAVIRGDEDKPSYKKKVLQESGAHVVDVHHEIGEKLQKIF